MKVALFLSTALVSIIAVESHAACYGSGAYKNCYDAETGNSYNVRRLGNTTYLDGYNSNTGSNWSQTSRNSGNTTYHNGYDSDGNSWSIQERQIGNMRSISGFDSDGNYVSKTCSAYGCW